MNPWLYDFLDWQFGDRPSWVVFSFFLINVPFTFGFGVAGFYLGLLIMAIPPLAWKYLYEESYLR